MLAKSAQRGALSPKKEEEPEPLLGNDACQLKSDELDDDVVDNYYTIDDAISKIGNGVFQYRLMFLTGAIWAADAMEMMLLSFVIPILRTDWDLASPLDGAISSCVFAGMLCGTATWSILADKIGRKKVVVISNFGCAVFGAISGLSVNIYMLLVMRFLVGFSVGGSGTAYTLFAEYAPQEVRGQMLVIEQSFWSLGAIFSVCLAWISLIHFNWRVYMLLSSIPLFIISACSRWIPESSRWLLAAGRHKEAQQVLHYIARVNRGKRFALTGSLQPATSVTTSQRGNPCDAFQLPYRRTTILIYTAFFMCTFGYYGICFISVKMFEADANAIDGWKHTKTYTQSLVSAVSELPGLVLGVCLLDRIGRKPTLLISFGVFALFSYLLLLPLIQRSDVLSVLCVFLARMHISLAFMALFIYFSEFYPTSIRSTALGMASAAGRIAGMMTSIVAEDLPFSSGILLYAIGGSIAFACTLFIGETLGIRMSSSLQAAPQSRKTDLDTDSVDTEQIEMHSVLQKQQYNKFDNT